MKKFKLIINGRIQLVIVLGILSMFIFTSCEEEEIISESLSSEVIGTYTGTLKNSTTSQSRMASIEVISINDSLVSMHCVADGFDSTIVMQLYQNYDSIMLCYTGQVFYDEYDHNKNNYDFCTNRQSGSMNNNWMNDGNCWGNSNKNWGNNTWAGNEQWNAWTNHMNTQHNQNDSHFGGFNPSMNSCIYKFSMPHNDANYFEIFQGVKDK